MTPLSSSSRSRLMSIERDMCGTPLARLVKVLAPHSRFRTMSRLHRSAKISEARATGQY